MEFLIIFLMVLLLSPSIAFSAYDFLMFAQQWPSTFCTSSTRKTDKCKPNYEHGVTDFRIHGLWPHNHTGAQPINCVGHDIPEMLPPVSVHLEILHSQYFIIVTISLKYNSNDFYFILSCNNRFPLIYNMIWTMHGHN